MEGYSMGADHDRAGWLLKVAGSDHHSVLGRFCVHVVLWLSSVPMPGCWIVSGRP